MLSEIDKNLEDLQTKIGVVRDIISASYEALNDLAVQRLILLRQKQRLHSNVISMEEFVNAQKQVQV